MAAAILSAIGRGFTSNQILRRLAAYAPEYNNYIYSAQAAGYVGSQILKRIHNGSSKKHLDEESFMTEDEKVTKKDAEGRRRRALTALGVIGTVGAVAAGAGYLYNRGAAVQPTQILPASPRTPQGGVVLQGNRQLPYKQQQLPGPPEQNRGGPPGIGPIAPLPPRTPQAQTPPNTPAPSSQPTPQQVMKAAPLKDILKSQRDPMKSISLVENLKQDGRFKLMISQGYDPETTSELLKMVMPREAVKAMEQIPGGMESVVEDYKNHLMQQQNQQSLQNFQEQQSPQQMPQIQEPQPQPHPNLQERMESMNPNPIEALQVPQKAEVPMTPQMEMPKPSNTIEFEPETQGNLALLPNGDIGEIESIGRGVATLKVNGENRGLPEDKIKFEPIGTEQAVQHIIDNIPEGMKSTSFESAFHLSIPGLDKPLDLMIVKFYDGKVAWYRDVPENIYDDIAAGRYAPKGKGKTGIAQYDPSTIDSRGAGFSQEIKENPYYKKGSGKTWGYAKNNYSLWQHVQQMIKKIAREKKDA